MLSESKRKFIASLQHKKYRLKHRRFVLEGDKIIMDAMRQRGNASVVLDELLATAAWFGRHPEVKDYPGLTATVLKPDDLKRVSSLVTPQEAIAIASIPGNDTRPEMLKKSRTILLDRIRDPGNLGTIIRTADWFGYRHIICSTDTVDAYNPKVVQATMGAILRVVIGYANLEEIIETGKKEGVPVMGLTLTGTSVYETELPEPMMLLAGNESTGIDASLLELLDREITIPAGEGVVAGSESLNVASAVAIACAEIGRRGK